MGSMKDNINATLVGASVYILVKKMLVAMLILRIHP